MASRRGKGEIPAEHERGGDGAPGHLVPELERQQIELGTRVCAGLDEVAGQLR